MRGLGKEQWKNLDGVEPDKEATPRRRNLISSNVEIRGIDHSALRKGGGGEGGGGGEERGGRGVGEVFGREGGGVEEKLRS